MSHSSREKLDLLNRTKKVIGQLESVSRALNENAACADVLQRLAAARCGAINSLMGVLMEDHIRNHMPNKTEVFMGGRQWTILSRVVRTRHLK